MTRRLPEFRDVVSLIPGGLIQFMDFRLDASALKRTALYFREQRRPGAHPEIARRQRQLLDN